MTKTVLEQALEHLLNKEEGKASALLHDYYVSIGRQVYEDIMTDEDQEDLAHSATQAVDEVDADLTQEAEEDDEMSMDGEEPATDDLEAELDSEEGAVPADADAADVADAMMDVESALAKLKAEFEEMISGEGDNDSEMGGEKSGEDMSQDSEEDTEFNNQFGDEMTGESLEEALELQKVKLGANTEGQAAGAGTGYANGVTGTTNTTSPVAKRNPMMARPATNFAGGTATGVPSGTKPAPAPTSKDLGMTTRPAVSKVAKPGTAPGREAGSSKSDLPTRG
jgi:hypothetical protein